MLGMVAKLPQIQGIGSCFAAAPHVWGTCLGFVRGEHRPREVQTFGHQGQQNLEPKARSSNRNQDHRSDHFGHPSGQVHVDLPLHPTLRPFGDFEWNQDTKNWQQKEDNGSGPLLLLEKASQLTKKNSVGALLNSFC